VIEIIFFFNDKYTKSAIVTMASILANASLHNDFRFTIIYDQEDPIADSSQEKLKKFGFYRNYDIRFIPFPKELENKFIKYFTEKSPDDKYPKIGLMKGLVDSVVTDIDKGLMLDTDLLVLNDLGDLYAKDLGSYEYAGAVTGGLNFKEGAIARHTSCEKLPSDYINAGVNFVNLKELRDNGFSEKIYQAFLNDRCRNWWYHEQDLINIVMSGRMLFISQRYNMVILTGYLEKHYPNGLLPFVIHFAGQKPWNETYLEKSGDYKSKPDAIKAYFPYLEFVENYFTVTQ
jgi:lipopolysaccharide biosynthesis glycosyltransferase